MSPTIGTGILVNQLFDRVDQSIDRAKNAGLALEMEAGFQVRKTIEKMQVAYAEVMNQTLDRVDQTIANQINDVKNLVFELEQKNKRTMQELASQAQTIANTLPFHNDRPQVTSYTPSYIQRLPGDSRPIYINIKGNFEHAAETGYQPQLTFHRQTFSPCVVTGQKLEFHIPFTTVFPTLASHTFTYAEGELNIPWKTTWLKLPQKIQNVFRLTIGALPTSPGTITLDYTLDVSKKIEKIKSQIDFLSSCSDAGNEDKKDYQFTLYADTGWNIEPGTTKVREVRGAGRRSGPYLVSDQDDRAVIRATTIKNSVDIGRGKESGWMEIETSFTQSKIEIVPELHAERLDLKWGEKRTFNHPLGKWKVTLVDLESKKLEFQGPDTFSSPYIKISREGTGFSILVTPPQDIQDF
ncbi:hypothetical protein [Candidatus Protochlamydia amoebophila]|uniref:Uncharacterized protein n=1 Tax=Candidatus Protochlamydia amoebophila TaxID=362787 RepID=A0A0C1JLJ7_9BACT|nr:hypothetical protein [Candidatus Protochlamydia amoebophila]KIC71451.1 hypothetical protein DB44_DP00100 [Candidatus Protochlamydia amoebophila]